MRDDAEKVTNAEHKFLMSMNLVALEGTDDTHLVTLNMRTVYYYWDIYKVDDQLSDEEKTKFSSDWKERRTIVNFF